MTLRAATHPQVIIPQSRDGEAAKPREYCFVHYADRETAEKACAAAKEDGVKYDEASSTALTVGGWADTCVVGWQAWLWCEAAIGVLWQLWGQMPAWLKTPERLRHAVMCWAELL